MYPGRFYIILLGFFLGALVFGALFFLNGMHGASYLVNDGGGVGLHYIDKPTYDRHFQGFIFVLTFLAAGLLLMLLILLPDQRGVPASLQVSTAPQPRRRAPPAPQAQAAPQPAPQPAAAAPPPPPASAAEAASGSTVQIEEELAAAAPPPEPAAPVAAPPAPSKSLDEEVLTAQPDPVELADIPDSRTDDTGEEDVVYGSGRVTDDSVWEFIQEYPDSAVKFLYRKTLENKPLSPTEEDIYRRWELRGLSRAKVREFVTGIMDWKTLPDDFPHNIWRALRDQIFENKSRHAAA